MPFNFKAARKTLNKSRDEQIKLLEQMRDENPRYLSSLAWEVFGAPVRLADTEGEYAELWAHVHWNDRAAEYIRAKEYRYCSIEVDLDHYNEKTGKHIGTAALASALTNRPFIKGMADVTLADDTNESDMMLIMTGRWHHIFYGEFSITSADLDEAVRNHNEVHRSANTDSPHPPTEMVIDYNHGSLAWDADAAIAAGWVREDGLFKRVSKVEANAGAQDAPKLTGSANGLPIILNTPVKENSMNDAQVRRILGLSESDAVTDEHRQQAVQKLAEQEETAFKATEATEGETPEADEAEETSESEEDEETPEADEPVVTAAQFTAQQRELNDIKKKLAEKDVEDVLAKALSDGKITPKQKESLKKRALKSAEGFTTVMEFVAELPGKVFSTTEIGKDDPESNGDPESQARAEFNANRAVYEKMGLSEEAFVRNAGVLK